MIDFITKRMQSFEINANLFLNAPLTFMLVVPTLSRLINKTTFCDQILCDFKEYLGKFSLMIGVSNDTKRKKKINKTTICMLVLKTRSTLNGFDFVL